MELNGLGNWGNYCTRIHSARPRNYRLEQPPGSHSPLPPPTPDQLHAVEGPGGQENILTPEEGETYLHPLQGEQRDEAAQDLIGLERRDSNAIPETGRPRRVKRPVNKFV